MEDKLPNGWVKCKLSDVASWGAGGTPKRTVSDYYGGDIPWLKTGDLNNSIIEKTSETITDLGLKSSSAKLFPKGSVCIAMYGATIGKTGILGFSSSTNQACAVAQTHEILSNRLLHYYLISEKQSFIEKGKGGAQPNISQTILKNHPFPLPPLPEQKRIVAKLDTLFASLDSTKARLEKIPQLLKNFRQAVLTQAVIGKLTEEWREGRELGEWETVSLEQISKSITDGDHQAPPKTQEGIPFLVISNVSKGYFDFENCTRFVSKDYFKALNEKRIPQKGDLLYTVTGSYGIALLVDFEKDFCFQRHIAIIRPNEALVYSHFLLFYLNSFQVLNQAHDVATGTAQKTVPLRGLRNFQINLPEIEEQHEIVRRVESLFAKADAIEQQYQKLKEKVDTLPQAILAKAFRGELVPQNPLDEPAAKLLERIRAEKEKMAPKGKQKRRK